jgi:hypothetical protein
MRVIIEATKRARIPAITGQDGASIAAEKDILSPALGAALNLFRSMGLPMAGRMLDIKLPFLLLKYANSRANRRISIRQTAAPILNMPVERLWSIRIVAEA